MGRSKNWKKRLSIMVAPLVAATATVSTASDQVGATTSDSDDDNVRAADVEETFELCSPDFGTGKVNSPASVTFKIEGTDGADITDITGLTFEVVNGSTTVDVTPSVSSVENLLDVFANIPIDQLLDTPLSTYAEPIAAPGLFALTCGTVTPDPDHPDDPDWRQTTFFPAGTSLIAKRDGTVIATSDISGRGASTDMNEQPGFVNAITDLAPRIGDCIGPAPTGTISALNGLLECSLFTDIYGALIEATGRRLHPRFAYAATLFPAIIAYQCFFADTCDDNSISDIPFWFFLPGITGSRSSSVIATLSNTMSALQNSDNEVHANNGAALSFSSPTRAVEFLENQTSAVATIAVEGGIAGVAYSISGDDADHFMIDSTTGELSFLNAPDYEEPLDTGYDNSYVVIVTASKDGYTSATQTVTVTVTNSETNGTCYQSRLLALFPLQDFDNLSMNEPVFHLTAFGRGMADALSDPRVNTWPEIDICLRDFNNGMSPFDDIDSVIGYLTLLLVLQTYIYQITMVDIPLGHVDPSMGYGAASVPVRLASLTRKPLAWTDNTMAPARVGRTYSDGVKANGTPAATYAITSGALPKGLTLNTTTGEITGKPRKRGTFTFTITASNAIGSMSQQFTMSVTQRIRPRLSATRDDLLVSFKGSVSPELRNKRVELQVYKYGAWRTVSQLDVKKNGTFESSVFTQWTQRYRVTAGNTRSLVITK